MSEGSIAVYGGMGALGSACVTFFKNKGYTVFSIDLVANEAADGNVIVKPTADLAEQGQQVQKQISDLLGDKKLSAVLCVAGGWRGGNAASDELFVSADLMFKQSVWTSLIASAVASSCLADDGLLCLTGAVPALDGTPGMIGYGMAKAAVHQLVKSLAKEDSGLPVNATTLAILPITLDTPMNRKFMPDADKSTWTPLDIIAELMFKWTTKSEKVDSGSLVRVETNNNETVFVVE
eukprot:m.19086 g.19086  ORF g.19086 m.19086 type:complete len:236 (-) comp8405_c0_seq1:125-832(-)